MNILEHKAILARKEKATLWVAWEIQKIYAEKIKRRDGLIIELHTLIKELEAKLKLKETP